MSGWGVLAQRGLDQLSPPEVEHTLLELPTNRGEYVGVLSDITGWPERSPLGRRVPTPADIALLDRQGGRWRAVARLDDLPALSQATLLFRCSFALDPMYDSGDLLYGAWHDPAIKAEHARRLAQHGRWMAHFAPLVADGSVVLAPDHLPGSWDPRPSWRAPRSDAAAHIHQTWALRTLLTLLYWADRLDAVLCTTQPEIVANLPLALELTAMHQVRLAALTEPATAHRVRVEQPAEVQAVWAEAWTEKRGRSPRRLEALACVLDRTRPLLPEAAVQEWTLAQADIASLADPALLLRRVLAEQDPRRTPPLARTKLRRRPLLLYRPPD